MIRIQNIYHMLAYAFQVLNGQGYKSLATEKFDNTAELCAAILSRGLSIQIRRGLDREYIPRTEPLSSPRGRLDISESIRDLTLLKRQIVCSYDEFSVNSNLNRIIRSTALELLRSDISRERKRELRRPMAFLNDVEPVDLRTVNWNIQYNQNNQTYRMLIGICCLVAKGLLQTQASGKTKLMDFLDGQKMHRLYEKFILEYYRREFPQIKARPSRIPWQVDDGADAMLPVMQTDVTLTHGDRTLIIDAKYYEHSTLSRYDRQTLHSSNLYQIFAYVKNEHVRRAGRVINEKAESTRPPHEVSGMLLYAGADGDVFLDNEYRMSGSRIIVQTLNLDCDFAMIKAQLNRIVAKYLGVAA